MHRLPSPEFSVISGFSKGGNKPRHNTSKPGAVITPIELLNVIPALNEFAFQRIHFIAPWSFAMHLTTKRITRTSDSTDLPDKRPTVHVGTTRSKISDKSLTQQVQVYSSARREYPAGSVAFSGRIARRVCEALRAKFGVSC